MGSDFDEGQVWAFLGLNVLTLIVLWLVVFGFFGLIAVLVAPPGRKLRWFLLTLCFLGPLGIGFAAIAPAKSPEPVLGRRMLYCVTCTARNDVPSNDAEYTCWQCQQEHRIS